MGQIDASADFTVKMTKCRPNAHLSVHAKCAHAACPRPSLRSVFLGHALTRAWRGPDGILNGLVFFSVLQEIMTETGIWGHHSNEACGRSILRSIWVNSRSILRSILVNSSETSGKPHGNLIETSWKPQETSSKQAPAGGLRARGVVFGHSGSGTLNTLCIPHP